MTASTAPRPRPLPAVTDPAPAPRGGGSKGWQIAVAAVTAVAVTLAVLLVVALVKLDNRDHAASAQSTQRATVLKAATSWAVKFGSYDYQHLTQDFSAASTLMTPSFAASYLATSKGLSPTLVQYKTTVKASVPAAAVMSLSSGKAEVLVLLDQIISSSQSTTPKINRNRLTVQLVLTKGHWLISHTDAT